MNAFQRILARIDDPAARKIIIMAKRERGELTDAQTDQLIQLCHVRNA